MKGLKDPRFFRGGDSILGFFQICASLLHLGKVRKSVIVVQLCGIEEGYHRKKNGPSWKKRSSRIGMSTGTGTKLQVVLMSLIWEIKGGEW